MMEWNEDENTMRMGMEWGFHSILMLGEEYKWMELCSVCGMCNMCSVWSVYSVCSVCVRAVCVVCVSCGFFLIIKNSKICFTIKFKNLKIIKFSDIEFK